MLFPAYQQTRQELKAQEQERARVQKLAIDRKSISVLNKSFDLPPDQKTRALIIEMWARVFNILAHYWFPSSDLWKASERIQTFLSREIVDRDGKTLFHDASHLSRWLTDSEKWQELKDYFEQLDKKGWIITMNHPTGVFLDPTAVIQLLPYEIWKKTVIITSTFQFPMNEKCFDKNGEWKFVPARATKDYIQQLRMLEKYVKDWWCVLLIPNGTETESQWTFRKMLQKWSKETLVLDFKLDHKKPFKWYLKTLLDRFGSPSKIQIDFSLWSLKDNKAA
jgi:hypothetical protein